MFFVWIFFFKGGMGSVWRNLEGDDRKRVSLVLKLGEYGQIINIYNHPPISTYFILKISKQSGVIYILIPPTYF
jgi:hypothetical protein